MTPSRSSTSWIKKAMACGCAICVLVLPGCQSPSNTVTNPTPQEFVLHGVVRDAADSSRIESVTVCLTGASQCDSTDSQGYFRFTLGDSGAVRLRANHPDYSILTSEADPETSSDTANIRSFFLLRSYGTAAGTVFDSVRQTPVPYALVRALDIADSSLIAHDTTNADGKFHLVKLTSSGEDYLFRIEKDGFRIQDQRQTVRAGDSAFLQINMWLYPSVTGKVVWADSQTAIVRAGLLVDGIPAQADGEGAFSFLEKHKTGTSYEITFFADGFDSLFIRHTAADTGVSLGRQVLLKSTGSFGGRFALQGQGEHRGVEILLSPKCTRKSSDSCYDPGTGHVLKLLRKHGVERTTGLSFKKETNSQGSAEIHDIPHGRYELRALFPGFKTHYQWITVGRGDTTRVDTVLPIESGTIRTSVTWKAADSPIIIRDTLRIAASGSLAIGPDAGIVMDHGACLLADSGYLSIQGTRQAPARLSPLKEGYKSSLRFFRASGASMPAISFVRFSSVRVYPGGGATFSSCQFVSEEEGDSLGQVVLQNGSDTVRFDQCDFVRINATRTSITMNPASESARALIQNSILYAVRDTLACRNFVENGQSSGLAIRNTAIHYHPALEAALLSLAGADTSNVFLGDPGYREARDGDLFLSDTSSVLSKSTSGSFLGAQGQE